MIGSTSQKHTVFIWIHGPDNTGLFYGLLSTCKTHKTTKETYPMAFTVNRLRMYLSALYDGCGFLFWYCLLFGYGRA